MELWIRSQNKNYLIKVDEIEIEEIEENFSSYVGNIHCRPYLITSEKGNLGFYSTKQRALEVLDEIQQILCPKKSKAIIGKNVEFIPSSVYVYEMPEE